MALLEINNVALRGVSAVVPPKKCHRMILTSSLMKKLSCLLIPWELRTVIWLMIRFAHLICAVSLLSV